MGVKIYKSKKLSDGSRIVTSMSPGTSICLDILKLLGKGLFFLMFFWIIIPIKLLKRK